MHAIHPCVRIHVVTFWVNIIKIEYLSAREVVIVHCHTYTHTHIKSTNWTLIIWNFSYTLFFMLFTNTSTKCIFCHYIYLFSSVPFHVHLFIHFKVALNCFFFVREMKKKRECNGVRDYTHAANMIMGKRTTTMMMSGAYSSCVCVCGNEWMNKWRKKADRMSGGVYFAYWNF